MSIKYTEDHEWVSIDGDIATVGITDHAQEQLGDIVYVDLPDAGTSVEKGVEAGVVESVKAASDVFSPVTGEVVEANQALADAPQTANEDPMGAGWFFKVKMSDMSELDDMMDETGYKSFIDS